MVERKRIGQQLGNYIITRYVKKGGFAEVYLGEHVRLKNQVAIKILHTFLDESVKQSFLQEAYTIANLRHPHIVSVFDFDFIEDTPYFVMDYAPHGSLRERYPKGQRAPIAEVVTYVKQLASALQYAHNQRIIHRDVKPENMLLRSEEEVLLTDFGIAETAHSSLSRPMQDQDVIGTLAYMAPEQLSGRTYTASDQYALAVVVYEWLCGKRPFEGTSSEIIAKHMHMPPRPLRELVFDLPLAVEEVVLKALAKDPKARHESVQAFAEALEAASDQTVDLKDLAATQPIPGPDQSDLPSSQEAVSGSANETDRLPREKHPPADQSISRHDVEAQGSPTERSASFYSAPTEGGEPTLPSLSDGSPPLPPAPPVPPVAQGSADRCPHCGGKVLPDAPYCPNCGKLVALGVPLSDEQEAFLDSMLRPPFSNVETVPLVDVSVLPAGERDLPTSRLAGTNPPETEFSTRTITPSKEHLADGEAGPSVEPAMNDLPTRELPPGMNLPDSQFATRAMTPSKEQLAGLSALSNGESPMNDLPTRELSPGVNLPDTLFSAQALAPSKEQLTAEGTALSKQKKYSDAVEIFDKALELDPRDGAVHWHKGNALRKMRGRNNDALFAYDKALEFDPENADYWLKKGELLFRLRRYDEARDAYEYALSVRKPAAPGVLVTCWVFYAKVLAVLQFYEQALNAYDEVLRIIPRRWRLWMRKGEILYALKRYSEALQAYEMAHSLNRQDDSIAHQCKMLQDLIAQQQEVARVSQSLRLDSATDERPDGSNSSNGAGGGTSWHPSTEFPIRASHSDRQHQAGSNSSVQPRVYKYDVFLSYWHSQSDTAWVEGLVRQLVERENIEVWYDKWQLVPGGLWVRENEAAMDQSGSVAVCIGKGTPGGWFQQEIDRALNRQAEDPSFYVIPVYLPGSDSESINPNGYLRLRTWVDFRDDDQEYAFQLLAHGIKGEPIRRWPPQETAPLDVTSPVAVMEDRLKTLKNWRDRNLVDEKVATDFQRMLLETIWFNPEQERRNP